MLWTDNQRSLWDLCVHKKKDSLNAEEFKICLLENWAAKHVKVTKVRDINATKYVTRSEYLPKNPLLKKVYKKFNQTSRSIRRGTRINKDLVTANTNDVSTISK